MVFMKSAFIYVVPESIPTYALYVNMDIQFDAQSINNVQQAHSLNNKRPI